MALRYINPLHRQPMSRGWEWLLFGTGALMLMLAAIVLTLVGWRNAQSFWVVPVVTAFWFGAGLLARRRRIRVNKPLVDWDRV